MADDEMLIKDPYINLKIPRGKHKARQRLDDKEIESLRSYKSENKTIQYMTDLAVVQSWTGMQHRDLMVITYSKNYRQNKRETTIDGRRKKTGEPYFIPISGQVIRIIEKYKTDSDRIFPMISLKTYNEYLKIIADGAGINRNLTSYVLRHTAATWLLRSGVPIEVIQAILGHSKIETTMIYTEIEKVYVSKAMRAVTRK